ncbi:MAG: DUF3221 domain-containing protein [Thermoleophilia bacterium]
MKLVLISITLIVAAFVLVSFPACSSTDKTGSDDATGKSRTSDSVKLPDSEPGIRGLITKSDSTAGSSYILVEENPADASGSNKASVRIKDQTKIYRRSGSRVEKSSEAALTIGKQVSVWFEGPVAESYPVQGSASVIVLED